MRRIRNWGYKAKFVFKFTSRRVLKILQSCSTILGLILTVGECIHWMFDSNIVYEWMHTYVVFVLLGCMIIAFYMNKIQLSYEYFLKGTDVKIKLKVSDILDSSGAIVIPTNTTFDTLMEDEFISVKSIQGQFQKKYFDNNLHALDILLEKGLEGNDCQKLDRKQTKNKRYPLGTVSKVFFGGKHYYFVAVADVNRHGRTENAEFENVQIALEGLWTALEDKGHIENLALPIMGTGRAGIKNASREKVIKEIIFSFVASAKERKVTEELVICIHPSDLEHKDLRLKELDEYLRYMCEYRYTDFDLNVEGVPMS